MDQTGQTPRKQLSRKILITIIGIEFLCFVLIAVTFFYFLPLDSLGKDLSNNHLTEETLYLEKPAHIPGLKPSDVITILEEQEFVCKGYGFNEAGKYSWMCQKEIPDLVFQVLILSRTEKTVDFIDANVNQFGIPSDETASKFLCFIATLPYGEEEQKEACGWINETLPDIVEVNEIRLETFKGLPHLLYGISDARSLELGRLP